MSVVNVQSQFMFDPELVELSLLNANVLRALNTGPSTKIQSTIEEEKSLVEDDEDNNKLLILINSQGFFHQSDTIAGGTQEMLQPRNTVATPMKRKSMYKTLSPKRHRVSFMDWIRRKLRSFDKTKKDLK